MPTIVHFDIPADDPARAKNFYSKLFGWKFEKPFETMEYYLFNTEDLEGKPGVGGGLGKREKADEKIMSYIGVTSKMNIFRRLKNWEERYWLRKCLYLDGDTLQSAWIPRTILLDSGRTIQR